MAASARFEVREILRLSGGPSIVFAGRVLYGSVRPGMEITIELQPQLTCTCKIQSVEYIDRGSVEDSLVGLACPELDPTEAAVYSDLCPPGTVVEING
jgi:hypothetical protein